MNYCSKCGTRLLPNGFCPYCNSNINLSTQSSSFSQSLTNTQYNNGFFQQNPSETCVSQNNGFTCYHYQQDIKNTNVLTNTENTQMKSSKNNMLKIILIILSVFSIFVILIVVGLILFFSHDPKKTNNTNISSEYSEEINNIDYDDINIIISSDEEF